MHYSSPYYTDDEQDNCLDTVETISLLEPKYDNLR